MTPEAMEVWRDACGAYEDASADQSDMPMRDMVIAGDQAAASIILAWAEKREAGLREALDEAACALEFSPIRNERSKRCAERIRTLLADHRSAG
jgi:hypothetical protein